MIIRKILSHPKVKEHVKNVLNDEVFAARALVVSNVTKDAIVYGVRFNQSSNNEEIPENKRKFVAALDLSCGIVTCITQLVLGFAISNRKLQDKMCKKLFGAVKSTDLFAKCQKGFVALTSLVAAGVLGERMIVPLIATPLASWIKNKHLKSTQPQPTYAPFHGFQSNHLYAPFINNKQKLV